MIKAPIKYTGIKTKIVPHILNLIKDIQYSRWVEPFLGSGVVCFNVNPKKALLNDLNSYVINFYQEIQNGKITPKILFDYLKQQEKLAQLDNEFYYTKREEFNKNPTTLDFFFLTLTGFNGLVRFNKKGKWNVPFKGDFLVPFKKEESLFSDRYLNVIIEKIRIIKDIITPEWQFTNNDFKEVFKKILPNDLIYCDPPYYGKFTGYFNEWEEKEEQELFNCLTQNKCKFILSSWLSSNNKTNPMIKKYWKDYNIVEINHQYKIASKVKNRHRVIEVLIYNF